MPLSALWGGPHGLDSSAEAGQAWPDKEHMHFNFGFNTVQVLWTLTFAAQLVLLVVLLGRDRARRFPWFTASVALVALRLLTSRLLFGRMPQLTMTTIFLAMADLTVVMSLLVLVELARQSLGGASRRAWIAGILGLALLGGGVAGAWGHWPAWSTMTAGTPLATLGLMQLFAQKVGVLADVVTVGLGVLVVLLGRRYGAGWKTHPQQLLVGLSTASLAQLAVQGIWQVIARTAAPHSMAEYTRVVGLREKLYNGNSAVYVLVAVWWIVCMWRDEPGTRETGEAVGEGAGDGSTG